MSSILEKLKGSKPTAAQLAERVTAAERAVAAITTALDQAEAEATAVAHDDAAYKDALAHVADLKAERSAAAERLEHLRRAHRETREREQAGFLGRLRADRQRLVVAKAKAAQEGSVAKQVEEKRHAEALAEIDKSINTPEYAIACHEHKLKFAEQGLCEADVTRFFELKEKRRKISLEISEGKLEDRLRSSRDRTRETKVNRDSAACSEEARKRFDEEFKTSSAEAERLEKEFLPLKGEIAAISAEMNAIEAKIGGC